MDLKQLTSPETLAALQTLGTALIGGAIAVTATYGKLRVILKELSPNSGSSIKDQVALIASEVSEMKGRLVSSEARQRVFLDRGTDLILEFDHHGKVQHVNRNLVMATGRMEGELAGSGWLNAITLADRIRVGNEWSEAVEERMAYETEIRLGDRMEQYQLRIMPFNGHDGTILGWFGTILRKAA